MRLGRFANSYFGITTVRLFLIYKNGCFRHISPEAMVIAVMELVATLLPAADKEFFWQPSGSAHRLSHRPYTLRFGCGFNACLAAVFENML